MAELGSLGINRGESGLIKSGVGVLKGIVVNSHSSGTVKIYDSTSATGIVLMNTFSFPAGSGVYNFADGINFNTGLYIAVGGTLDCTVIYN
jgi:hypothetical protein